MVKRYYSSGEGDTEGNGYDHVLRNALQNKSAFDVLFDDVQVSSVEMQPSSINHYYWQVVTHAKMTAPFISATTSSRA